MPKLSLFQGIKPVTRGGAVRDALAGIQLAAMNIPQALGYTRIAGMPVVTGFYTLLLPMLAFAVFGSSRYLVVSADSATAAILAGRLSGMAPLASPQYVELAAMVALLTAAFLLIARIFKLGFLADFLSQTVLVGFLTGVGFQVGIAVLGTMLGIEVQSHRTLGQLVEVIRSLPQVHLPTLFVSAVAVAVSFVIRWLSPKLPGPLIAVAGAIAASAIWDFAGQGIPVVGPVSGLPHFGLPHVPWKDVVSLLGVAGSCFVMIVAQSAATARFYAARHHQRDDEDADLVGLSAANAAAALSGTFVVDGSPTQTAMVENSGGQSQLAQVTTAVAVALVLLFLTKPLQYLPRCVLGAIVFFIAVRLIDLRGMRDIRRESPGEYRLAWITAATVVLLGVEQGIVLAMVLSLLRIVRHSYQPHTGVLVLKGEGEPLQLVPPVPGTFTEPGLVMYRFGAALFYANAGLFSDQIRSLVGPAPPAVRWLVVDAEAITNIDFTAARVVRELHQDLVQCGVMLGFARVSVSLRSDLDRHRLTEVIGPEYLFDRLHDAIQAFNEDH